MTGSDTGSDGRYPPQALSLDDVRGLLRRAGCEQLYVKELAWNHDSKRQIYLTSDLSAFNIFPNRIEYDPPMPRGLEATRKRKRNEDEGRIFGHLDLSWISTDGTTSPAREAKIIYYPQYPEVRLSGFLRGVRNLPAKYLREKSGEVYHNRLLFLGITAQDRVIAFLAVGHDDLREALWRIPGYSQDAGLNPVPLFPADESPRQRLLSRLRAIHEKGWISGARLSAEGVVPCRAPNAVGYTLEAELGVSPNGTNAPDFMGWEVKAHTVPRFEATENKVVTVFTPEPDLGVYHDQGVLEFLRRWGYADRAGREDRWNFGGIHRVGEVSQLTGLTLSLSGFRPGSPGRIEPDGWLALLAPDGEMAAGWSFTKLIDCWRQKHAAAVYVPAVRMETADGYAFRYGTEALLCEDTDFLKVLEVLTEGLLYLDPAVKALRWSSGSPEIKRRNQFRIKMQHVPRLYRKAETVSLQES